MTRILLIGVTGMLKIAAAHAVARAKQAVLVSREAQDFSFDNDLLDFKLTRLALSYDEPAPYLDAIARHAPYDLVLSWIRPPADILRAALDGMVAPGGRLIEVFGSRALHTRPDGEAPIAERRARSLSLQPGITYAQLILGFKMESGVSRWLTHEEISAAVIAQMEKPQARAIAGQLEPWNRRPA